MRNRFGAVLQGIQYDGTHSNFKLKYKDKLLNEKQVAAVAEIDKYGLGNRFMGKATIDVSGKYKYRRGEKPWFHYENKPEYSEQPVRENTWRVKYMSEEFLRNYFAKAMGSSTFTSADQRDFAKRQKVSHPGEYSIPQFILNHPMGQSRQSTFKNAWLFLGIITKSMVKEQIHGNGISINLLRRTGQRNANTVKLNDPSQAEH